MNLHCIRTIEFDAGHRLINHEGKCKYLHGHRYIVEAYFTNKEQSNKLDDLGRVIDFGEIKTRLKGWIDDNLDHNMILHIDDQTLGKTIEKSTGQKIFYLPYNPSSENIAKYLLEEVCPKIFETTTVKCTKIRLFETTNCYVEIDA